MKEEGGGAGAASCLAPAQSPSFRQTWRRAIFKVPLSPEAVALLKELAQRTGVTPEEFARRAILDRMEDTEDYLIAEERLRTSTGETVPLEEVLKEFSDDLADAK